MTTIFLSRLLSIISISIVFTSLECRAATPPQQSIYQAVLATTVSATDCQPAVGWMNGGTRFWYEKNTDEGPEPWVFDAATGNQSPLWDREQFLNSLDQELGHPAEIPGTEFDELTISTEGTSVTFSLDGTAYWLSLETYELRRLPEADPLEEAFGISEQQRNTPNLYERELFLAGSAQFPASRAPDYQWFAYIDEHNIWLRNTADGRSMQLTHGGTYDDSWDFDTGPVSPWSPNSLFLLATRVERSGVARMPQVHYLKPKLEVAWIRTQTAGGVLDMSEHFIVPVLGDKPVKLAIENAQDSYFRPLGWLPDSSEVMIAQFTRTFDAVRILAANPVSGAVRLVMSETSDSFVRLQHDILWGGPTGFSLLQDGKHFLWESERSGWNQLYLYDTSGRLIRQVSRGDYPVDSIVRVDESYVYYLARGVPRPYDLQLFRAPLFNGRPTQITQGEGQHKVSLSPSGSYFVDTFSTVSTPPQTEVRSTEGDLIARLKPNDPLSPASVAWPAPEEFTVKSADGAYDLWGVMYKPYNFDPNSKYPLIEYIYGGPQLILSPKGFCPERGKISLFQQALAQLGFIVVILDARGTPGRSKAFQDVVHGEWSKFVIADHSSAIRQLTEKHAFIDENSVGIFGRSWGGYFALRALVEKPDIYRAAVSIAPVFDAWVSILSEPYLGMPAENPQAYRDADIQPLVSETLHPFMMAVGTNDSTFPSVMKMAATLNQAGVHYDLLVYPNQDHVIAGSDGDLMRQRIALFFEEHLQTGGQME